MDADKHERLRGFRIGDAVRERRALALRIHQVDGRAAALELLFQVPADREVDFIFPVGGEEAERADAELAVADVDHDGHTLDARFAGRVIEAENQVVSVEIGVITEEAVCRIEFERDLGAAPVGGAEQRVLRQGKIIRHLGGILEIDREGAGGVFCDVGDLLIHIENDVGIAAIRIDGHAVDAVAAEILAAGLGDVLRIHPLAGLEVIIGEGVVPFFVDDFVPVGVVERALRQRITVVIREIVQGVRREGFRRACGHSHEVAVPRLRGDGHIRAGRALRIGGSPGGVDDDVAELLGRRA